MIKVTIVGTGNVSHHLQRVFKDTDEVNLVQVISSRSVSSDSNLNNYSNSKISENPDIYIIAVSDDAIKKVSRHFENTTKLVVHTSGSVSIGTLPNSIRKGVFYPLQTFSKERKVDFKSIPICVEADNLKDLELLKTLASAISNNVNEINSEQRKALHLAAVFVNNFSNHLYQIGDEICQNQQVSFELLKPLIKETAIKIENLSPVDAQTGPAKRNDRKTIKNHLEQLQNKKQKEIYSVLTKSIQETNGEKL